MTSRSLKVRLISDFNLEIFGRYLGNDPSFPNCRVEQAPFGQVYQILKAPGEPSEDVDSAVVWTRAEGVVESFGQALGFASVSAGDVLLEVDRFADALLHYRQKVKHLFVATWVAPPGQRGYGMLDWHPDLGIAQLLARMNLRLSERLQEAQGIYLLDTERWLRFAGQRAFSAKAWFTTKAGFGNPVFQQATLDLKAALAGSLGRARKLIIVDLDQTLWGGIVGEQGWSRLRLGGHDPQGEAFVAFQDSLKGLTRRGIQLAIVSKNDEAVALEAIDKHPEMHLRRSDFAGWRINWRDKAENVAELVDELNLGLEAAVFIDDNPAERGRVRDAFPEVLVPDWPQDPALYAETLFGLRCFDIPALSTEDRQRTAYAVDERQRRTARSSAGSLDDWLATVGTRVDAEPLGGSNLPRVTQLFNKTNQMNLRTRRLSESELSAWVSPANRSVLIFRVRDRFGDSGLTGVISLELLDQQAWIVDFILSCRVLGRGVEETMLHAAVCQAQRHGASRVHTRYFPTERNRRCLEFWQRCGFAQPEEHHFTWDTAQPYPFPTYIDLTIAPREVQE